MVTIFSKLQIKIHGEIDFFPDKNINIRFSYTFNKHVQKMTQNQAVKRIWAQYVSYFREEAEKHQGY